MKVYDVENQETHEVIEKGDKVVFLEVERYDNLVVLSRKRYDEMVYEHELQEIYEPDEYIPLDD